MISPTISLLVLVGILMLTWCGGMMYMFHYGNWERAGKAFIIIGGVATIIWFIVNTISAVLVLTLTSIP